MALLDDYFYSVHQQAQAQEEKHLWRFDLPEIEGFKDKLRDRNTGKLKPLRMKTAQKKALAWLQTTGDGSGVLSLDTGMGKTMVALAAARKWVVDGDMPEGSNGRFLYVAEGNLRGNLVGQAYAYFEKHAAGDMAGRIDALSYRQFMRAWETKKYPDGQIEYWQGKPWAPEEYVACFFDEAHILKKYTTKIAAAVLAFKHPRKICLTASPMDQEPEEAYTLYCIANNIDLNDTDPRLRRKNRRDARRFRDRYCERVDTEVVGVKQDPVVQQDLHEWVARNIFYSDKSEPTNREDYDLGELDQMQTSVQMAPEVEEDYRATAAQCATALAGWVARYRDGGKKTDSLGRQRKDPLAWRKELRTKAGAEVGPLLRRLDTLANDPGELHPGAKNVKHEEAAKIAVAAVKAGKRCLLWAEKATLVDKAAMRMSAAMPGTYHAAATTKSVRLYKGGSEVRGIYSEDYPYRAPFTERMYDRDPEDPEAGKTLQNEWAVFVLDKIVSADQRIATLTCQGRYATGHNLQQFSTVVHLDRNSWSNEAMKQRTARAYRTGQKSSVDEHTIDVAYSDTQHADDRYDKTYDEVRALGQQVQAQLFDEIIKAAQGYDLSAPWHDIPKRMASKYHIDKRTVELMLGPYFTDLGE